MRSPLFVACLVALGMAPVSPHAGAECIDYADPEYPLILGGVDTPGCAWGVAISGGIAYLSDEQHGFKVIDVSDPRDPRIVATLGTPAPAQGLAIAGDYAYVADWTGGLQVIDVRDPENPRIVGSAATGSARDVAVSGGLAYVADWFSGLVVVDVTDPEHPHVVGNVETPTWASGIAVSGEFAYVTNYNYPGQVNRLVVIDVSDPGSPAIVGQVQMDGAIDVALAGSHAYVAADYVGLLVIDVSNPQSPRRVAHVNTPGEAIAVAIEGSFAYVADWIGGLHVIDVANPETPRIVGSALEPPVSAQGVAVANGLVHVSDCQQGFLIFPTQCEAASVSEIAWRAPRLTAFPNPASRQVRLDLAVSAPGRVCATIYDCAGRLVRHALDEPLAAGPYSLSWDGRDDLDRDVAPGIYLARVSTSEGTRIARMVILR